MHLEHAEVVAQSKAIKEFLQITNDVFDIFKSQNLQQKFYKRLINPDNYELILCKLEKCKEYLLNLSLEHGQLLIYSNRKTEFFSFLMNIESLKMLYQDIC